MRLLALDLGDRRIGMATGGVPGLPATPIGHLERDTLARDLTKLLEICRQRDIEGFVVGMPFGLSGDMGRQAQLAEGFIRELRKQTTLPVYAVDERFSSLSAERLLREGGIQPSRHRGAVDAAAAALILERFLAGHPPSQVE